MTRDEALRCSYTHEDVFTPDGDAGVVDRVHGDEVYVVGRLVHGWFHVSELKTVAQVREEG